ncbi:YciI family protein [Actinoplanes sp. NPDC023801]|uniref:YciI family protein n=1 Tax=Actinoplanes sp. NPDC023801 TaxID=3154595 RepID=UPI0033C1623C
MFVITLTYRAGLDQIDAALQDHVAWLDQQYADGVFLASGRRVPRVGGVILATGVTPAELECRLDLDPFRRQGLAEYTVTEFVASRTAPGLESLLT